MTPAGRSVWILPNPARYHLGPASSSLESITVSSNPSPRRRLRLVTESDLGDPRPAEAEGGATAGRSAKPRRAAGGRSGRAAAERDLDRVAGTSSPRRVEVSLGQIAPLIADALRSGRCWLQDFADDSVTIDADLYEILLAYAKLRRQDAA